MQFVLFTKHWKDDDVPGMVGKTLRIGADGVDLAVRPGYAVNPVNAGTALVPCVAAFRKAGLTVPLVTTDADFTDPGSPAAERLAAAMAEAGIPVAKLGYWRWRGPETPYWVTVDEIRRALEGFEALGRKHGVAFCYHTHSDYFGLNAAAMMHLVRDRDPAHIGVYLDTGHLAYCGEPFRMAVDIVGEYLKLVSFKDTFFYRQNPESEELPRWKRVIVPAGHGVVDWERVMGALADVGFDGTCSVHCEFASSSPEEFIELQRREVGFLRSIHVSTAAGRG